MVDVMTISAWHMIDRPMIKAVAVAAAFFLAAPLFAADDAEPSQIEKGQYLAHAGGCTTCHTADDDGAAPLAGGRALVSPFGTFYSPNITPDLETGIGSWSDDDFVNALWEGLSPDGDHYFPAFPYTAYTGITRADALSIKAYLFSVAPVVSNNLEHDLPFYMSTRLAAGTWKKMYFDAQRFVAEPTQSEQWNRGAYLVRHLGHCGECHTPRGRLGVLLMDQELSGNPELSDDESVPNITPHKDNGIGRWSASDIEYFLDIGMLPDGDFTGSSMGAVIKDNTSQLTRNDRLAIAAYLKSLPAR